MPERRVTRRPARNPLQRHATRIRTDTQNEMPLPNSTQNLCRETRNFGCFPKFLALPKEIQLMVWKWWRQSESTIRHYMHQGREGRCYAAYDLKREKHVTTIHRSEDPDKNDPVDPMDFKIRFTNSVSVVDPETRPSSICSLLRPGSAGRPAPPSIYPAYIWVNFEEDVFFLSNCGYKYPGQLRFLYSGINAKIPKRLGTHHWPKRIQKLAIRHRGFSELDRQAFAQLTGLKVVFIVVNSNGVRKPDGWDSEGFHQLPPEGPPAPRMIGERYAFDINPNWRQAKLHADQISAILKDQQGRSIEVKVVLDQVDAWTMG